MNELTTTDHQQTDDSDRPARVDHPLGIYFSLDEDIYHQDIALGSSDMKKLATSAPDYWWSSQYNPLWEPEELTDALIKGRARHTIVLEGREKFESLYGRKTLSFATNDGKKQRDAFASAGKTPLSAADYDRTLVVGHVIRNNPFIAQAFDGAVGHEVSVFWMARGIKRKARFDCLKPRATVDLKNISNDRDIPFPKACMRYIDNYKAHVQAEHYREARLAMRELLASGRVFGDGYNPEALKEAVFSDEHAWVWVFAQSAGAPVTWATMLSYKHRQLDVIDDSTGEIIKEGGPEIINPIFEMGRTEIDRAEKNWHSYVDRFGLDTPWLLLEPIKELDVGDMPPWFLRNAEGA